MGQTGTLAGPGRGLACRLLVFRRTLQQNEAGLSYLRMPIIQVSGISVLGQIWLELFQLVKDFQQRFLGRILPEYYSQFIKTLIAVIVAYLVVY